MGGFIFSFLPIWRVAGVDHGLNLWDYLHESNTEEYEMRHIPYEQAVEKARLAYSNNQN